VAENAAVAVDALAVLLNAPAEFSADKI